ncbi:MAG: NYN domain-containing protein, partial [Corynebacterium glyciniphilum]|nr:NYN domain-containing protein [Corynebacterium glyciniphilum]
SGGQQNPFDIGEQYAVWWFQHAATTEQQDGAHVLCGGGLPPEVDRPLLQFACETLHEYTLTEYQRVNLRDGFHSGIRGILLNR